MKKKLKPNIRALHENDEENKRFKSFFTKALRKGVS